MQDIYAFDVGDFGKFGLMRHLMAGHPNQVLGVIWYATNLGATGGDGKHIGYLTEACGTRRRYAEALKCCDPFLFETFRRAHGIGRSISQLERCEALPPRTLYFRNIVETGSDRPNWFVRAQQAVSNADIVFVDPDNGIASPGSLTESSPRHVLLSELETLASSGAGLVVYHHLGRQKGGHKVEIERVGTILRQCLRARVVAVRYRRGTSRAFFVVDGERAPALTQQAEQLEGSAWCKCGHMEVLPVSQVAGKTQTVNAAAN